MLETNIVIHVNIMRGETWIWKHITQSCKNFTGPSTAMESEIIVEGFQKTEEIHQLRYLSFIGDGDSSVFAKLKEKVSYGNIIKKN